MGAPWGLLGQGAQALGFFISLIFAKRIDIAEQDLSYVKSDAFSTAKKKVFKYTLK